jgi:hypothetical protein
MYAVIVFLIRRVWCKNIYEQLQLFLVLWIILSETPTTARASLPSYKQGLVDSFLRHWSRDMSTKDCARGKLDSVALQCDSAVFIIA